jgi:hypothetical protein
MKTNTLFMLAMLALASVAGAQSTQLGAIRVTLIAGASPSRGGRTEVVRRAQRAPRDIVIVDRNATAEDLAAALAMINALRKQFGDSLTTDFRARPDVIRPGTRWDNSDYRSWLIEQLVRLRSAKPTDFPEFGTVRAVQITLPAPRGAITSDGGRK